MGHATFDRHPTTRDLRGQEGHGIGLGLWLSLPFWLALGLTVNLCLP
jgi:hypothetical protein